MIKVLIVDDSKVILELLTNILSDDPKIKVIGTAKNGKEAIEFVRYNKPDVISMDISMPVMNGFEATKEIMKSTPLPIIILSEMLNPQNAEDTFKVLKAGAVAIMNKPNGSDKKELNIYSKNLINKIKLLSEIRVIKRIYRDPINDTNVDKTINDRIKKVDVPKFVVKPEIVAIGASTGGPAVLETILSNIPQTFNLPVVIVQHIVSGFTNGLVEWLKNTSKIPVEIPVQRQKVELNKCYLAPDDFHLEIRNGYFNLIDNKAFSANCPSIGRLFESIADEYRNKSIAVLLTGMGNDGTKELKKLKDLGATTIVQDEGSSVVYGIPGEAIKLDAVNYILTPHEIAEFLSQFKT